MCFLFSILCATLCNSKILCKNCVSTFGTELGCLVLSSSEFLQFLQYFLPHHTPQSKYYSPHIMEILFTKRTPQSRFYSPHTTSKTNHHNPESRYYSPHIMEILFTKRTPQSRFYSPHTTSKTNHHNPESRYYSPHHHNQDYIHAIRRDFFQYDISRNL